MECVPLSRATRKSSIMVGGSEVGEEIGTRDESLGPFILGGSEVGRRARR